MHASVMEFARRQVAQYKLADLPTLEVGSLDVNGSVRQLFRGPYWGIDMQPGPGVDQIVNAHDLEPYWQLEEERPQVIMCTEMLEHDSAPWISLERMAAIGAPAAFLVLTCRGYDRRGCFPIHGYPDDLWRFSTSGIDALLRHTGWSPRTVENDLEAPGVLATAWNKG